MRSGGLAVSFIPDHQIYVRYIETFKTDHVQAIFVDAGTVVTSFMHGGKRAPMLMSALEDGPSITFTVGWRDQLKAQIDQNGRAARLTLNETGVPCSLLFKTSS